MKPLKIHALKLTAVTLFSLFAVEGIAAPFVLGQEEMDQITAAGVSMSATASALAIGSPHTSTTTLTNTHSVSFVSPRGNHVSLGVAVAYGSACCGTTNATSANVDAAATGNRTLTQTSSSSLAVPGWSRSIGYGGAVSY